VISLRLLSRICFNPVHKRLAKEIKRRGLSALLSSLLVIVILVLANSFVSAIVRKISGSTARTLPAHVPQLLDLAITLGLLQTIQGE
jgi:predicted PurR-regulated permease PerM